MTGIGRVLVFVFFWLMAAGDALFALFLFTRALSALVSQLRAPWRSVRGAARVNMPDGREKVMIKP